MTSLFVPGHNGYVNKLCDVNMYVGDCMDHSIFHKRRLISYRTQGARQKSMPYIVMVQLSITRSPSQIIGFGMPRRLLSFSQGHQLLAREFLLLPRHH